MTGPHRDSGASRRRAIQTVAALVMAVVPFVVAIPAAFAGVGLTVTPIFAGNATVGQTGLSGSIQVVNNSTPLESLGNVTLLGLNLVPACGTTGFFGAGDCPAPQADPGVFKIGPTGVGQPATACAGQTFNINIVDPSTGQVQFTPNAGPIVLTAPSTANSFCRIGFTYDVLKAPTHPAAGSPPNTVVTDQIGFSSAAASLGGSTGLGSGASAVTVHLAQPGLTTAATATAKVGTPFADTATVTAANPPGPAPTGTLTFSLYGPNNPSCSSPAAFTTRVPVSAGPGSYPSAPFTATASGTYRWVVAYTGDGNDAPATTACGDAGEIATIVPATPAIATNASSSISVGGSLSDQAILSGGVNPTGTLIFGAFGPDNATCNATPVFTSSAVTVAGNGGYTSPSFTPPAPGSYNWVATYGGDANNAAATGACGAAGETSSVNKAGPTVVTTASASVAVGGAISDTAVLSGGIAPAGTMSFNGYGPNNATCTGAARFTSTATVSGDGTYRSAAFTAAQAGSYQFVAAYSGDANNSAVTGGCGAANGSVVVTRTEPTIAATASPTVPAGGAISDTATLSGAVSPTGTIVFTLFGPSNYNCSGAANFTSTKAAGNGGYASDPFTVAAPGTYNWVAVYGGDANNASATTGCGGATQFVTVTAGKTTPTIVTAASGTVPTGGAISDTATLAGGPTATGTIIFTVFGPDNPTCAGAPTYTATRTITGNGNYSSSPYTALAAGIFRWVAAYSGDAGNNAVTSGCNDANGSVIVTPAGPQIATQASPGPVTVGGAISDTASLTGGTGATGTITFTVFGPDNAICFGAPVFTSARPVSGNGFYLSDPFTPKAPGMYRFVAAYSGDANNAAAGPTACRDSAASVVVAAANPTLTTQVSPPVTVGGTITDTATLAAGTSPTGTITFQVFGPDNNTCTGIPLITSTKAVTGNGSYTSDSLIVPAAGAYRFAATYSGDAKNSPAGPTACLDANEVSAGLMASPAVVTTAWRLVTASNAIVGDTAILTGGFNPTGTISFKLFGPNNAACGGAAAFAASVNVGGSGSYVSPSTTLTTPGSYRFVATYSGDSNNNAAGPTACNDPNETIQVPRPSTFSSISAVTSPSADLGQPISDTASLTTGFTAGGTITFTVFGPDNATCTGTPGFTATKPVSGSGTYVSDGFTPTAPGTYRFVASYSGDATDNPAGPTACNDPAAAVAVFARPQIAVTKVASPASRVEPGGNFTFTVTLGNPSPTVAVKITSLFDNIYGDLSTRPGSTCGPLLSSTLAPGASPPPCTFSGPFTGVRGDRQTDIVTVTGVESHGLIAAATAQATVTLTADKALFTSPVDSQANIDTTKPFTWSPTPAGQGYYLAIGTILYGTDLANSGVLPPTQSSYNVPDLPTGQTLYATLLTEVNGAWTRFQAITFTAAVGHATFTYPVDGRANVDTSQPFVWSSVAGAQGYALAVGTTLYGTDQVNSGVLPPNTSSYLMPDLPAGKTLYATVLVEVNGAWRFWAITFTAAVGHATLLHPVNGETAVSNAQPFTWTAYAGAQAYFLAIGTAPMNVDIVSSGALAPSQTSYDLPPLPARKLLYGALFTQVNGVWRVQAITFSAVTG